LVAESMYGGYAFNPDNWLNASGDSQVVPKERRGSIPEHVPVKNQSTYTWEFYQGQPGKMEVDVSYTFQGEKPAGKISLEINGQVLEAVAKPTGKTITEPNRDWVVDNYKSHRIGEVDIEKPGYYTVKLTIEPPKANPVNFQWTWMH